ncbi:unnamed protein product [Brachionus calyciflorus]|uniref:SURF1-like protein n=1 Tax=Brachionus calyciflorus TaxID=104777 RepID=A0A813XSI1_9BILA|nr:unnamed protein product [Brachionus calyciflorus]
MIAKNFFRINNLLVYPKSPKNFFFSKISTNQTNSSTKDPKKQNKKSSKLNLSEEKNSSNGNFSSYALLAIPIVTFGIGIWQIKRRNDKINLIESFKNRMKTDINELPEDIKDYDSFLKENEYKPFKVKGYFLNSNEILLTPRNDITSSIKLSGAYVITPFVLSNNLNKIILVNRGYVPYTYFSLASRLDTQTENEVELVGILRSNEPSCKFTPINKPPNEWHHRNIKEISEFLKTEPIFLDAVKTSKLPIGGQTEVDLKNDHMSYILTWFGVSSVSIIVWLRLFAKALF